MAQRGGNVVGRNTQIRITQNDRREYSRLVKNTKAKIRRTFQNYGVNLSNDVEIPDITSFSSRSEFNEWKQKQQSFTNRANTHYQFKRNQHGVSASKFLLNEIERNTKKAQDLAKREIERVKDKMTATGSTVGQLSQQMGRPETYTGVSRVADFNFENVKSYRDLMRRREVIEKKANPSHYDQRKQQMKENFQEILRLSFHSDVDELVDKIGKIPADDFYEMYLIYIDDFDFDLYDSEGQNVLGGEDQISVLLSHVDDYLEGNMNFDLKDFPNKF